MPISNPPRMKLALLGPLGTYSHQAAYERFGETVEYLPQKSIADVYDTLGPEIPLALLPCENSTFGIVLETYDLLRSADSKFIHITDEVTLGIKHCLLVKRGTQLSSVRRILSHEQALGQCSRYIGKNLPDATLVKTASTATAAKMVAEASDYYDAAICSRVCLRMFSNLELVEEGIQNEDRNFTRFFVASTRPISDDNNSQAFARLRCRDKNVHIASLLGTLGPLVTQVDRRPATNGSTPWDDVYFIRLQRNGDDGGNWKNSVESALARIQDAGGDVSLLGIW